MSRMFRGVSGSLIQCVDPNCDHEGSGYGTHEEPCPWCRHHDCDLDCNPPEED